LNIWLQTTFQFLGGRIFVPFTDAAHGNNVMLGHGSGPNNGKKRLG